MFRNNTKLIITFFIFLLLPLSSAFNATSSNFEIIAGAEGEIAASNESTSYKWSFGGYEQWIGDNQTNLFKYCLGFYCLEWPISAIIPGPGPPGRGGGGGIDLRYIISTDRCPEGMELTLINNKPYCTYPKELLIMERIKYVYTPNLIIFIIGTFIIFLIYQERKKRKEEEEEKETEEEPEEEE